MSTTLEPIVDDFVADLADAGLHVAGRHGARGPSIDVELTIWRALRRAFRKAVGRGVEPRTGSLLASLTEAAYRALLERGFRGSFLDLELGLWRAFRRISLQGRYRNLLHFRAPEAFPGSPQLAAAAC